MAGRVAPFLQSLDVIDKVPDESVKLAADQ